MLNSTPEMMKEGGMVTDLLNSNDIYYLDHYDMMFKDLLKTGIDAKDRIKDIDEGNLINIDIIPNLEESVKLVTQITRSVSREILIIFSSTNGYLRTQKAAGGLDSLNQIAFGGIKVKVLTHLDPTKEDKINPTIKISTPSI